MQDRYQIADSIGKGGVSEVFRALDLKTGREVAIKRLLPFDETRLNEPQVKSLHREALALSQLRHPNVVHLHEFGEDEQGPFAVLEMIEGESLHTVIHDGALTYPDFLDVASQLLSALAAAEEIRLLHRDLKPGNVMLCVNDQGRLQAKILDFGVSKFLSRPSQQTVDHKGAILGSVDYIAPEQLDLQPLDPRTDLYSMGCILYFCLTQSPPFHGYSAADTIRNHLAHDVKPLHLDRKDIPMIVSDWVMKLIAREPDDRPLGAKHALALLEKLSPLEQVPGARLEDLDDFTAPLSSGTILHQPVTRIDTTGSHHRPPKSMEKKSRPGEIPV
ncbi:MAG: serine/threonine-protein kinase [Verrucomicrobiales bacterium]|nr:serine/threonine-protein kinase [Verrucomicrobiales bacterium]